MTAQQLKNSILQMAIQGKLVPQDPSDEPASVLIQRIREEKEQMIKDGKIKKEKNPSFVFRGDDGLFYEKVGNKQSICIEDEVPFEIPDSWEWVRLSTICTKLVDGDHNPPKGETKETPYIMASSTNINNDTLVELSNVRYLSKSVFDKENERTDVKRGDIFFTSVGTLGRSCVYKGGKYICFQRSVSVITTLIYNYYLKYYFDSGYIQQKIVAEATGTAQKGFYLNQLGKLLISVPPINEQHRIVEKIRLILPYIENCNEKEKKLSSLNEAFPTLLKKSILQMAIQGKLVSQDPNDEPATVLIKRIHDEKEQLIKDGKIKRDKHESVIYKRDGAYYEKVNGEESCIDDEIPFEIPDSWEWARISSICSIINGDRGKNYPAKSTLTNSGIPFISAINLDGKGVINDENLLCMSERQYEKLRSGKLCKGDIIICIRGSLGKHGIYSYEQGAIASSLVIARLFYNPSEFAKYIMIYLDSELFKEEIKKYDNGTAQPNLAAKSLEQFLIPIPPCNEQERIADKVNQILQVIDITHK